MVYEPVDSIETSHLASFGVKRIRRLAQSEDPEAEPSVAEKHGG